MRNTGTALMGIGTAAGENRAAEAARAAISSPLLESSVEGASGLLLNITARATRPLRGQRGRRDRAGRGRPEREHHLRRGRRRRDRRHVRVTVIATGFERGHAEWAAQRAPERRASPADRSSSTSRRTSSTCRRSCARTALFGFAAAPLRLALAEEGVDALARVGRDGIRCHDVARMDVRIRQRAVELLVERDLADGDRLGARARDARGELASPPRGARAAPRG